MIAAIGFSYLNAKDVDVMKQIEKGAAAAKSALRSCLPISRISELMRPMPPTDKLAEASDMDSTTARSASYRKTPSSESEGLEIQTRPSKEEVQEFQAAILKLQTKLGVIDVIEDLAYSCDSIRQIGSRNGWVYPIDWNSPDWAWDDVKYQLEMPDLEFLLREVEILDVSRANSVATPSPRSSVDYTSEEDILQDSMEESATRVNDIEDLSDDGSRTSNIEDLKEDVSAKDDVGDFPTTAYLQPWQHALSSRIARHRLTQRISALEMQERRYSM